MSRPFHPLLFAAFPVLFLVAHNRDVTSISEAKVPLAVTLAAVIALAVIAGVITKQPRRAAIVISALVVLFFSYGHVWQLLEGLSIEGFQAGGDLVLGAIWLMVGAAIAIGVARSKRSWLDATRVLNIVSLVMVATVVFTIATDQASSSEPDDGVVETYGADPGPHPRDIYYLVFDRYADADALGVHFGFDNSTFIDFLEGKGFVVTAGSRANYENTHTSLASSMNLEHLDTLLAAVKRPSKDLEPIFDRVKRNRIAGILKAVGYRYVHVGSWASFTASSPLADVNLKPISGSEFTRALYGSTALAPVLRSAGTPTGDESDTQRDATRGAFAALDQAITQRGPKFVFSHFIVPHPPYVFDRDGNYTPESTRRGNIDGYLEQVRYSNTEIERIVNRLLAVPPEEQPIIIIQSDEGPYPSLTTSFPESWATQPPGDVRVKYGILNAYHLPGHRDAVYETITPVNTFRVLLNTYFGTRLPLLPDESYAKAGRADAYTLVPLGERVNGRLERHNADQTVRDSAR